MAPPGIEPGLTQIKTTTMCRHTTRPWHLYGATRNRTGANTDLKQPQCVVIPLDHGTYLI
ncbi:hypothetical protein N7449_003931 [Penicillium cf. viridicatum]|uniref:Uncharacterized protein n=1 Tax=Penicillium cf. viridicatum TaxID=2972119 RepID=A0A9W9T4U6_9EURO|nr:hypothetical protein N7449_003931 [Penicillium cf. viridicatum]